jgi:16S rRNA (guanine(966)-N(2))-methyltransferase RsmD
MRIIAGRFKSRRLKTLAGPTTRPTSDQLRETLFNILGDRVAGATFADGYAGSGGVGLEALSRGAAYVYFLERFLPAVRIIEENLGHLGVTQGYEILPVDVGLGLEQLGARPVRLDLIFLDPPYQAAEEYEPVLTLLARSSLLTPTSLVVVEHSRRQLLAESYGRLSRARARRQGDAVLSFYRKA